MEEEKKKKGRIVRQWQVCGQGGRVVKGKRTGSERKRGEKKREE